MKRFCLFILLFLMFGLGSVLNAQQQPPFILTAYGGLFFPANAEFSVTYRSSSDLMYGFGVCLPVQSTIFLISDYAFFKSEAFLNVPNDSSLSLSEKFLHVGLMNKLQLSKTLFLRFSAGMNLVTITQRSSSTQTPEQSVEGDKKIGYFGGFGLEQLTGDPHVSFFADVVYDYRRSRQKELSGDFGGVRIVVGAHLIMF